VLSHLPSTSTLRWAEFRRKGAEILTVLLVVVLLEHMFARPIETVQFVAGRSRILPGLSPWRVLAVERIENGRRSGISRHSARFVLGGIQLLDRINWPPVSVWRDSWRYALPDTAQRWRACRQLR